MTAANPPSPPSQQSKNVFRLHGVNVLNRKNVDSIARLTALERRRATHILDERQRRDTMNQLLTELASLVQESAAQATLTTTIITTTPPQPSLPTRPASTTTTTPTLNTDGTDKRPARPPVKSNSITTLRNAIAEIRRLRACAGLQAISNSHTSSSSSTSGGHHHHHHLASSSSSITSKRPPRSPSHSQRSSCSRSTSPVSFFPEQHASSSSSSSLSTLAALATKHREGLEDEGSQHSGESCSSPSPMSSPKLQASSSSYSLRAIVSSSSLSSSSLAQEAYARDPAARHQLHSPPLSPSSPLTSSQYHFSGGAARGGPFFLASMGSLEGGKSHRNGASGLHPQPQLELQPQPQPQPQQQQPYLPPLASVVSPMSSMTFLSSQEREDEREYRSRTQTECVSSMGQFEYQPGGPWSGGGGPSSSCPVE